MTSRSRHLLVAALIALFADQVTKYLAVSALTPALVGHQGLARIGAFLTATPGAVSGGERTVIPGYLSLRYTENRGAAWGLSDSVPLSARRPIVLLAGAVALGFLLFLLMRVPLAHGASKLALAVMLGGAIGNFLDRLFRGYVVDFIELHWLDHAALRWPTFNLADVAIWLGLGLVLREMARVTHAPAPAGLSAGLPNS